MVTRIAGQRFCWLPALLGAVLMTPPLVAHAQKSVVIDHPPAAVAREIPTYRHHAPPPLGTRGRQGFDPARDVDIGIILPPDQLEHWRSNYTPDSYRLNGYDGVRQGNATVCRYPDGSVAYSTAGVNCPNRQRTPPGGKSWSTQ